MPLLSLESHLIILSVMFCSEMDRSVEYKCQRGFTLVGAQSSSCLNGQWSPAPPQCIRDSPCDRNPGLSGHFLSSSDCRLEICGTFDCRPARTPSGFECIEPLSEGNL